jgi:hypothetical protein
VLGGGSVVEDLAHYATGIDPVDGVVEPYNPYLGITILLVSASIAMSGFAARSMITNMK